MANICPCTFGNSVSLALNNFRNAKKFREKGTEQTASAKVLSRKVNTCYSLEKSNSSWGYFVAFQLEDRRELELKTSDADYRQLREGTNAVITWQDGELISFVTEAE